MILSFLNLLSKRAECFQMSNPFFFHEQTSICTSISYTLFHWFVEFPKKVIENDGRKLARHIKNRGRPTEQTWQKYREFRRQRNVLAGKRINYFFFKGQETL